MSTPSWRAACSTGVPTGKRPRRPDGMKTIKGSPLPLPFPALLFPLFTLISAPSAATIYRTLNVVSPPPRSLGCGGECAYAISPALANRRLSINGLGSRFRGGLDAFGPATSRAATAAPAPILAPTTAARTGAFAIGRRLAELADPSGAMGVLAHQHVAAHHADHLFEMQRV